MKDFPNEPISSVTHLFGAILAIAALVILVVFSVRDGDAWQATSLTIYGSAMILLYASSTSYHFLNKNTLKKEVFKRIDHSMIYVLIAGTYTPICLVTLRGALGWALFGVIWGLAICGIIIKSMGIRLNEWFSTAGYVIMGWIIAAALKPVLLATGWPGLAWLFAGGILYSIGALLHVIDVKVGSRRLLGLHEVFHLLVIAGSFCHFWFMLKYVIG
jgi:hemolysin III